MNNVAPILACLVLTALSPLKAGAQMIGIGGGLAIPNDRIAQVPADLVASGWSGAAEMAKSGYYLELRGRLGGRLALIGGVGYNHFGESRSEYLDGGNSEVALKTSQTLIPISLGADMRLGDGLLVPYLTLEATYNIYKRTFERPEGEFSAPFDIRSVTDSRLGAAVGGGVNVDLGLAEMSVGAKLHLPNLLNQEQGESEIYYAQLGAAVYFGL